MPINYTHPIGPMPQSGAPMPSQSLGGGGILSGLGGMPIPSLTGGGSSASSGLNTRTDFGSVYVNNGSNVAFWVIIFGAGYLLWKKLKK